MRVLAKSLTIIAALTFFAATVGINLVANFIPAAFGLANLAPARISARSGGIITAVIAFFIGGLWVSLISNIGIAGFVDTLGAVLAPLYGIVVADYYLVRKQSLNVQDLFSAEPGSTYYFDKGWNKRALVAFSVASVFSVVSVWTPALAAFAGFSWLFGALLGGVLHLVLMNRKAGMPAVPGVAG